jgi:hypothetical protein
VTYELRGLPAGTYLATAIESLALNVWNDADVRELLRSAATHFRLEDGDQRALNLRLSATPDRLSAR